MVLGMGMGMGMGMVIVVRVCVCANHYNCRVVLYMILGVVVCTIFRFTERCVTSVCVQESQVSRNGSLICVEFAFVLLEGPPPHIV